MGLQFSITAIGTIIVQSAVNIYGPVHMAGFSAAGKIQNIFCHSIYSLRCNHSNLCRSEQGRRKNGSCETGSPLHADDGPGMERFCYVPDVFFSENI